MMHRSAQRDYSDVAALTLDVGLPERDQVLLFGHGTSTSPDCRVLETNHRVVIPDGGFKEAFYVVSVGSKNDLEARNCHEHRMWAVRMLRGGRASIEHRST